MKKDMLLRLSEPFIESMAGAGAFLCVPGNVMTVGWAQIGWMWSKPILTVLVRPSRRTYDIIEACPDFTLSIPRAGTMKEALAYAGTVSGRDENKFDHEDLTALPARSVSAPIIAGCGTYAECKVVYKRDMTAEFMDEDIIARGYPKGDFHRMYYGEILEVY